MLLSVKAASSSHGVDAQEVKDSSRLVLGERKIMM